MEVVRASFGAAIRNQRSALGLTQERLADRSGLHRTYISDVERGTRNISLEAMARLAHALEIPLSRLFEEAKMNGHSGLVEVVLVEDNPRDAELTMRAFRRAKFTNPVQVARDGEEAINLLLNTAKTEADEVSRSYVILLDLKLPKMSGVEVLRRLKADPKTQNIPVVVLTDSAQHQDAVECQQLGVQAYLRKPVDFQNFSALAPQLPVEWRLHISGEVPIVS